MLKRGWWALIRLYSSISASTSLRTWIHSTVSAAATIDAVLGGRLVGATK
jgi:hypothetical protein